MKYGLGKGGYGFQYDELERMKQAQFKATNQTGSWNHMLDHYNESGINYDANGNILSLQRTGFNQVNAFSSIDDLLYQYEGNRLVSVHDAIINTNDNGYGNFDFTDGAFLATEYVYDANGNMIQDLNKGITNITYNHLNLPEQITINGNSIEFIYDANGIRHHKITNDNVNITNDYYDGNFHYGEQELDFILTSEGRIVPPSNNVENVHRYEYHYTDHQNNLRLAYSDLDGDNKIDANTEVLQSQDYYPFGMEHQGYQPPLVQIGAAHQYTFQGQLKHEDFDLNWSQFKWRNHMPDLGRFFNVDPLSESYTHNSTYAFSENRLLDGIELEGREFDGVIDDAFNWVIEQTNEIINHYIDKTVESITEDVQEIKEHIQENTTTNLQVGEFSATFTLGARNSNIGFRGVLDQPGEGPVSSDINLGSVTLVTISGNLYDMNDGALNFNIDYLGEDGKIIFTQGVEIDGQTVVDGIPIGAFFGVNKESTFENGNVSESSVTAYAGAAAFIFNVTGQGTVNFNSNDEFSGASIGTSIGTGYTKNIPLTNGMNIGVVQSYNFNLVSGSINYITNEEKLKRAEEAQNP